MFHLTKLSSFTNTSNLPFCERLLTFHVPMTESCFANLAVAFSQSVPLLLSETATATVVYLSLPSLLAPDNNADVFILGRGRSSIVLEFSVVFMVVFNGRT